MIESGRPRKVIIYTTPILGLVCMGGGGGGGGGAEGVKDSAEYTECF